MKQQDKALQQALSNIDKKSKQMALPDGFADNLMQQIMAEQENVEREALSVELEMPIVDHQVEKTAEPKKKWALVWSSVAACAAVVIAAFLINGGNTSITPSASNIASITDKKANSNENAISFFAPSTTAETISKSTENTTGTANHTDKANIAETSQSIDEENPVHERNSASEKIAVPEKITVTEANNYSPTLEDIKAKKETANMNHVMASTSFEEAAKEIKAKGEEFLSQI